jgi:drug/metabolite transporter (DMT)-like permease
MGIALGLTAAFCWGVNDYFVVLAARRTGARRTVLCFHLIATLALALVVLTAGDLAGVSGRQLLALLLLGGLGAASYLAYYRALAVGPISIVSPIVSGYAAVTVILAVLLLGERLNGGQTVAVAVSMAGVLLASTDLGQLRRTRRVALTGVVLAVVSMLWIGGFVFGLSYYTQELGWLVPIFLGRAFACLFLLAGAVRGAQWPFSGVSPRLVGLLALVGLLDTLGYVAFNVGVQHADTALVATASAPYAAIPVIMGVALLRERPALNQWAGVAAVFTGVVLLALAS